MDLDEGGDTRRSPTDAHRTGIAVSLLVLACVLTIAATALPLFEFSLPGSPESLPPVDAQVGARGTTLTNGLVVYGPPLGVALWIAAGALLATIVLVLLRHRGTVVSAAKSAILCCASLVIGVTLTVGTHGFTQTAWNPEPDVSVDWGMSALIAAACCLILLALLEHRYRGPIPRSVRADVPPPEHGVSITVPSSAPRTPDDTQR